MKILKTILSIPKTIHFNLKVFPIKIALKMPVFISYNVRLVNNRKNCIEINGPISRFMIKININNGSDGINTGLNKRGYLNISGNGKIVFNGSADFCSGVSIRVDRGNLEFGNNFYCNNSCLFSCSEGIKIGDDALLGWNVNIRDSDGHIVYDLNNKENKPLGRKRIDISNHVWLAAHVDILKGSCIPDNCVIGYNSCVTRKFTDSNSLIAGYPAKVIKQNIRWE